MTNLKKFQQKRYLMFVLSGIELNKNYRLDDPKLTDIFRQSRKDSIPKDLGATLNENQISLPNDFNKNYQSFFFNELV